MTGPAPIIEGLDGHREFLLSAPDRTPYVESRSGPFPSADNLRTTLRVRRNMETWQEHYALGRTANNLAAVLICEDDHEGALEALREAESAFIAMLQGGNPHPQEKTFGGLAMVKYNAAVLFWTAGDDGDNFKFADDNRLGAFEALIGIGEDADEAAEFVRSAVEAFPQLS